jgi:hypothetical protein
VLYGKTAYTIALEEGTSVDEAKALLKAHRRLFKRFWLWITGVTTEALATRRISTKFGWIQLILSRKEREAHLNEEGRVKPESPFSAPARWNCIAPEADCEAKRTFVPNKPAFAAEKPGDSLPSLPRHLIESPPSQLHRHLSILLCPP